MDSYLDFKKENLINAKERFVPQSRFEPKIDASISKIVGRKIFQQDPRLIKLIVKWKGNKPNTSKEPDSFLDDPRKVQELKKVLNSSL